MQWNLVNVFIVNDHKRVDHRNKTWDPHGSLQSTWTRLNTVQFYVNVNVKWSRYRPGAAQRVGRGIALLFHDHSTRRGWVFSSMPRLYLTPGKDPVPILQEAGWAPGPVWMGGKSCTHWDSIPDCPAHSQSLYWATWTTQFYILTVFNNAISHSEYKWQDTKVRSVHKVVDMS